MSEFGDRISAAYASKGKALDLGRGVVAGATHPSAVVQLYTYMAKQSSNAQAWRDSLTIGGVDGTLANRFKGTAAAGNIRGKSGTIDQVSALSGYMTTAAGEKVVLSIIVNGVAETRMRTSLADDIVVSLANFNGKIDP